MTTLVNALWGALTNSFCRSKMAKKRQQSRFLRGAYKLRNPNRITGRARRKQLITVFGEAMSRAASDASRVYRGEVARHRSGREPSPPSFGTKLVAGESPYPLKKRKKTD